MIHNAHAAICLAEGNPGAALDTLGDVLDGTAPVVHATVRDDVSASSLPGRVSWAAWLIPGETAPVRGSTLLWCRGRTTPR